MQIRTQRWIDRFMGIPLCWATAWLGRLLPARHSEKDPACWTCILVVKFFGMGSILLSASFLAALRKRSPRARIIFLTFAQHREITERLPQISETLTVSPASFGEFLRDTLRVVCTLARRRPDVVFDLEFFSKFSTLLSTLSGSPIRVGYELPAGWRKFNVTHPVHLDRSAHVTTMLSRQLGAVGVQSEFSQSTPRLSATSVERISMREKVGISETGEQIFCINVNTGVTSLNRRWDPSKFMHVVATFANRYQQARFIFTGTGGERSYVMGILAGYPQLGEKTINSAGVLSIGELIALLEHTTLLLTNDTGPMHLAAAVGTPTVALFGPESPSFYGPLGNIDIVYKNLACSPCLNVYNAKQFICPYNARCMQDITVNEVLAAIYRQLNVEAICAA